MIHAKPLFSVIGGCPDAPVRIAMSLVHPRERVDIPVRDVLMIEARAETTLVFAGERFCRTYPMAHVEVAFKPHICARIYRLTSCIVEEAIDLVVGGDVICRPVVREPLGIYDSFHISACDMEEAEERAAKLRKGWIIPKLRVV